MSRIQFVNLVVKPLVVLIFIISAAIISEIVDQRTGVRISGSRIARILHHVMAYFSGAGIFYLTLLWKN